MRAEHWRQITEIAATQGGLITAAQLRLVGASPPAIARSVSEGALAAIRNRVYVVAGVPQDPTWPTRAVSLVAPKAAISHRSAGWLHGLLARPPRLIEVITPPGVPLYLQGVRPLQSKFGSDEVTEVDGIRVTTVIRTLIDLWAALPPDWVERLVHEAVMRHLCGYDQLREAAAEQGVFFPFLGDARGSTPLELEWDRILREAGLPEPVRQYQVTIGKRVFVLDNAWPNHKVALEVDGYESHRTRDNFDRDHDKLAALQAAGWSVVSATARSKRSHVLAALRRLLAQSTAAGAVDCAS